MAVISADTAKKIQQAPGQKAAAEAEWLQSKEQNVAEEWKARSWVVFIIVSLQRRVGLRAAQVLSPVP